MMRTLRQSMLWCLLAMVTMGQVALAQSPDQSPAQLLAQLDASPHIRQLAFGNSQWVDQEVGLGAMKKLGGKWKFKDSERVTGQLTSYTWQVIDGFTAAEVLATIEAFVEESAQSELLFACDGRACGHPAQWANRVFKERLLYGAADLQRYRVYAFAGEQPARLVLYSASRTADRQYLQVQWVELAPEAESGNLLDELL